jgi:predicted deacylase
VTVVREAAGVERITLDGGPDATTEMIVARGSGQGPTVSIIGGVHGDEPEGSIAIDALLAGLDTSRLKGIIRAVPVCNPVAAQADSRVNPLDGLNLAREFPGAPDGRPTQKLAHVLAREVIAGSDLLVDLHSAGRDYLMPFFAGYDASRPWSTISARAARAFGAPLIWEHNAVAAGRSISAASELEVPSIYVEAAGGGMVSGATIDQLLSGLKRVLAEFGLAGPTEAAPPPARLLRGGDGNVDESVSCTIAGLCVTRIAAGEVADSGDAIADIYVDGVVAERVLAPLKGTVMMLRRKPRVEAGQAIAMLGPIPVAAR